MKKVSGIKKFNFNLKEIYSESWDYLKDSRNYIYFAIILFACFFIVGYFVKLPLEIENSLMDMLRELMKEIEGKGFLELGWFIFFNNLKVAFIGIVLGVFAGIGSILLVISNGFVPGFVASMTVNEFGILSLWRLLPHGIFEMPAIFISFGLGIKLGTFVFEKEKKKAFFEYLKKSMLVLLAIILPLLFVAAIIETILIVSGI